MGVSCFTGRWVGGWGCGVVLVGEVIDWKFCLDIFIFMELLTS